MSTDRRIRVLIAGRVQGVFFRESTRRLAVRLGLCGWVRNRTDDRVEAVFQGTAAAVAEALAWCHTGPATAAVSQVESVEEVVAGDDGFVVRPTSDAD